MASGGGADYDELNARLMGVSTKSTLYFNAKHHDDLAKEAASLAKEVVETRLRAAALEAENLDLKRQVGTLAHSLGAAKDQLRRKDEELQAAAAKEVETEEPEKGAERKAEAAVASTTEEEKEKTWEKWFNERVAPLAGQLDQQFRVNALSRLNVPWTLTCPSGHPNVHSFTAKEWDELIRTGSTRFACSQPGCIHGTLGPLAGIEIRSLWMMQILLSSPQSGTPAGDTGAPVVS
jgi:hypothetical protein